LKEIWQRVKIVGDKGKNSFRRGFAGNRRGSDGLEKHKSYPTAGSHRSQRNTVTPTASVRLKVNENDITEAAIGVGPVDAVINAVKKAVLATEPITLEQYHVKSITGGTDAMVEVVVRMRKGAKTATATGVREDIVMASMDAVLAGMNVLTALNGNETTKKTEKQ
jgi:D-citramalate synthase